MQMSGLFDAFPLGGTRRTSQGELPVPYHVYDGEVWLVGGWVQASAAGQVLRGQAARPLLSQDGRVPAALWICQFNNASLGPHAELQLSIGVTRGEHAVIGSGPFELLRLLALDPALRQFPAQLWNDSAPVVAYNRELLGLDAQLCRASFETSKDGAWTDFRYERAEGGALLSGRLARPRRQPVKAAWQMTMALGQRGMGRISAQPWISAQLLSPAGPVFGENAEEQAYLAARQTVVTLFDAGSSRLVFGDADLGGFGFQPTFVEWMRGFEFVYLGPYNLGDGGGG